MKSTLNEITDEVVKESGSIDLEEALEGYRVLEDARAYMLKTPYFRCLSAYCKLHEVKHVLEIGTCTGASAIAMAHHAVKVDTFDVTSDDIDCSLEDKNIDFYPLMKPSHCLNINLDPYDLIFIDIDHKGDMERRLDHKLTEEYEGIAFYDDIYFSPDMAAFWESIKNPKLGLPWHFTGFGIVRYT
jgi:predicted O-methyltransferase YrrM